MSRRIFLLAALLTLLTACGRSTPTNYYLLESSLGPVQADGLPAKSLRVAQVSVPEYLDRSGIVSRVDGQTQLIVAQFHAWAEPVSNGVRRVTQEVLTRRCWPGHQCAALRRRKQRRFHPFAGRAAPGRQF